MQKTGSKGLVLGAFPGDLCHAMGMSHTVQNSQKWVSVSNERLDGERRKWHINRFNAIHEGTDQEKLSMGWIAKLATRREP